MDENTLIRIITYLNKKGTISEKKFNWLYKNKDIILELLQIYFDYLKNFAYDNEYYIKKYNKSNLIDFKTLCKKYLDKNLNN